MKTLHLTIKILRNKKLYHWQQARNSLMTNTNTAFLCPTEKLHKLNILKDKLLSPHYNVI